MAALDSYLREVKQYADMVASGPDVCGRAVACDSRFLGDVLGELLELRQLTARPNGQPLRRTVDDKEQA